MAAPYLRLALADNPAAIDLTAATSAGGVWSDLQGETGADWWYWQNHTYEARSKANGNQQLFPVVFGTPAPMLNSNAYASINWDLRDELNGQGPGPQSGCVVVNMLAGQVNAGVRWSDINAPYGSQRKFTFVGRAENGSYLVTASMNDPSVGPQTLSLPANKGFTCEYHSNKPTAKLTIEIRRTAGSGDGYIFAQAAYIGVPVKAPQPRGAARYLAYLSMTGSQS